MLSWSLVNLKIETAVVSELDFRGCFNGGEAGIQYVQMQVEVDLGSEAKFDQ